jgi:poly-gamma-glutamate synthesis protein (capsule biosynthesis protein)
MQTRRFRLGRATKADVLWLRDTLNREGQRFGTRVELSGDDTLLLRWDWLHHNPQEKEIK